MAMIRVMSYIVDEWVAPPFVVTCIFVRFLGSASTGTVVREGNVPGVLDCNKLLLIAFTDKHSRTHGAHGRAFAAHLLLKKKEHARTSGVRTFSIRHKPPASPC